MAKRYHPDTGSREADARKFADVKDAYQIVMESGTVEGVGTPNARPGLCDVYVVIIVSGEKEGILNLVISTVCFVLDIVKIR